MAKPFGDVQAMGREQAEAAEVKFSPTDEPRRRGGKGFWAVVGVVVLLFAWWAAFRVFHSSGGFPKVNSDEWQAVFLTNNQVYFGHLKNYNREYVTLAGIFYLQVAEPLQQGATPPGPGLNLVKLGGELHGPQDTMYIPKDKIMFWENLKTDSQVVRAITAFLKQNQK